MPSSKFEIWPHMNRLTYVVATRRRSRTRREIRAIRGRWIGTFVTSPSYNVLGASGMLSLSWLEVFSLPHSLKCNILESGIEKGKLKTFELAWENTRHFATPPLRSLAKWHLRKERRNSTLMMHHYPDLGSAWFDWTRQIFSESKYFPNMGSDKSSVWNFFACFSGMLLLKT